MSRFTFITLTDMKGMKVRLRPEFIRGYNWDENGWWPDDKGIPCTLLYSGDSLCYFLKETPEEIDDLLNTIGTEFVWLEETAGGV